MSRAGAETLRPDCDWPDVPCLANLAANRTIMCPAASVMIEKFATSRGGVSSEFLDLNHTSKTMILVSLLIPKFAGDASI